MSVLRSAACFCLLLAAACRYSLLAGLSVKDNPASKNECALTMLLD
jgi:hypothetical protein